MSNLENLQKDVEYAFKHFKSGNGTGFPDIDRACYLALENYVEYLKQKQLEIYNLKLKSQLEDLTLDNP